MFLSFFMCVYLHLFFTCCVFFCTLVYLSMLPSFWWIKDLYCKSERQWCIFLYDSAGGSIVQPRPSTSFLHAESHHAVHHVVLADASHLPVTAWPRREDLSRNIHPTVVLRLHAIHLGEHAEDIRKSASLWCVIACLVDCLQSAHCHIMTAKCSYILGYSSKRYIK